MYYPVVHRSLPQNEVIIGVVVDRWNTTVGIVLGKFGGFVFSLLEIQVDRFVGQAEFVKHKGDLPGSVCLKLA